MIAADMVAWFVLFPGVASRPPRWRRLLAPGYRHVLALREDGERRSLVIEHCGAVMQVQSVALPIGELVRDLQSALVATVLMVLTPPGEGPPRLRLPLTCVEAVKAAIGVWAPWIVTPRQLARHLRRRHSAVTILPTTILPNPGL